MRLSLPLTMLAALTLVVVLSACGATRTVTVTVIQTVTTATTTQATVTVPNVLGLREPLAVQQVLRAGLRVRVFRRPRASVPSGTVYEEAPPPSAGVSRGSAVTLFVSTGKH